MKPQFTFDRNTLLFDAGTGLAILITTKRGRMRQKSVRVASAHAALDWCIAHAASLIYIPAPDPAKN